MPHFKIGDLWRPGGIESIVEQMMTPAGSVGGIDVDDAASGKSLDIFTYLRVRPRCPFLFETDFLEPVWFNEVRGPRFDRVLLEPVCVMDCWEVEDGEILVLTPWTSSDGSCLISCSSSRKPSINAIEYADKPP
jgi:hypothetical protein